MMENDVTNKYKRIKGYTTGIWPSQVALQSRP